MRKNPVVGGQYPIMVSPIFTQFPLNWHLHNAFSMGVLKHYAGVVSEPIVDVCLLAAAKPRVLKKGKRGRGQGHVTP